jgi:hypothetical protein
LRWGSEWPRFLRQKLVVKDYFAICETMQSINSASGNIIAQLLFRFRDVPPVERGTSD